MPCPPGILGASVAMSQEKAAPFASAGAAVIAVPWPGCLDLGIDCLLDTDAFGLLAVGGGPGGWLCPPSQHGKGWVWLSLSRLAREVTLSPAHAMLEQDGGAAGGARHALAHTVVPMLDLHPHRVPGASSPGRKYFLGKPLSCFPDGSLVLAEITLVSRNHQKRGFLKSAVYVPPFLGGFFFGG